MGQNPTCENPRAQSVKTTTLAAALTWSVLLTARVRGADWPAYRADAARSGATDEVLPRELGLAWTFLPAAGPRPAWRSSNRMTFDLTFQPVVAGARVVFGSSADDKVYALDAATGRVCWTFYTEGPVRFAPAAWRDRAFVASDDGHLYALALADGRLLWKHRGGPDGRLSMGNDRLISRWPARGGPVVRDDTVYYAAGIWPSDGVYVHALDAGTGRVAWSNTDSGGLDMPQPHPTAEARSGVSPQGYLLASGEAIFVPTGRAVPAAFDRRTGKLLYYRLQENQQRGGTRAMLGAGLLFNANCMFDQATGNAVGDCRPGPMAVREGLFVQAAGDTLSTLELAEFEKPDRRGKPVRSRGLRASKEIGLDARAREVVLAGREAVCGQAGRVSVVDMDAGRVRWSSAIEGEALGLAVAAGRLVVGTDQGRIYCFASGAAGAPRAVDEDEPNRSGQDPIDYGRAAEEILARSNVREGICFDLGCGEGRLAEELARRSGLIVYGLEADGAKVAAGRRRLDAAGLYPARVTILHRDPAEGGCPAYVANLVVSAAALSDGRVPAGEDRIRHVQRPWGGVVCIGRLGAMEIQQRGPLDGAGEWTHQNALAANTICSGDRVKGPLEMLWYRDVDFEITNRHAQGPAPLAKQGFLVVEGVDGVCALDAYNGRTLWTCPIEGVLADYNGVHHDVAVGETGSNICLGDQSVYVAFGPRALRIDLATGRKLTEFPTPAGPRDRHRAWGYLACTDGLLFGSIANADHAISPRYADVKLRNESVLLFAMDPLTGRLRWTYKPEHSLRHNAIAVHAGRVYLIDRPVSLADRITEPKPNGKPRPALAPGEQPGGTLVALEAASGRVLWRQRDDIWGTQLAVSPERGILLMSYQGLKHKFFKLPSEVGGRLAGFDAANGRRLWQRDARYVTRPILNGDTIYAEGGAWDLRTGDEIPFAFQRSYGCGQICSGRHLMLFRSATLGYWDLTREAGVENFGGIRPGCWFNAIPAGGLVLVPDGSSRCVCSYQMQAWLALAPQGGG